MSRNLEQQLQLASKAQEKYVIAITDMVDKNLSLPYKQLQSVGMAQKMRTIFQDQMKPQTQYLRNDDYAQEINGYTIAHMFDKDESEVIARRSEYCLECEIDNLELLKEEYFSNNAIGGETYFYHTDEVASGWQPESLQDVYDNHINRPMFLYGRLIRVVSYNSRLVDDENYLSYFLDGFSLALLKNKLTTIRDIDGLIVGEFNMKIKGKTEQEEINLHGYCEVLANFKIIVLNESVPFVYRENLTSEPVIEMKERKTCLNPIKSLDKVFMACRLGSTSLKFKYDSFTPSTCKHYGLVLIGRAAEFCQPIKHKDFDLQPYKCPCCSNINKFMDQLYFNLRDGVINPWFVIAFGLGLYFKNITNIIYPS